MPALSRENVRNFFVGALCAAVAVLFFARCRGTTGSAERVAGPSSGYVKLDDIMRARALTPDEAAAALKVFVPPGKHDDFLMVTSGGHRGTVMLYGVPSMRLLKEVPVFAADAWQGWGQGEIG